MVFSTFSVSKLPGYILPVVPPFAMLCARELRRDTSRLFRMACLIEAGTMIFIGVAFAFFGEMLNVDPHVDGSLIAMVTFVIRGDPDRDWPVVETSGPGCIQPGDNVFLVPFGVSMIMPRFNLSDTMRPLSQALVGLVPDDQVVYIYKPQRSAEYGLRYYRSGKAVAINTPDQLLAIVTGQSEVLCIADNKIVDEVAHIANVEMKTVLPLGNQTAFKVWRSK